MTLETIVKYEQGNKSLSKSCLQEKVIVFLFLFLLLMWIHMHVSNTCYLYKINKHTHIECFMFNISIISSALNSSKLYFKGCILFHCMNTV